MQNMGACGTAIIHHERVLKTTNADSNTMVAFDEMTKAHMHEMQVSIMATWSR